MNVPPTQFIRVPVDDLRRLNEQLYVAVGAPPAQAQIITELLIDTDLRGVFSHGTRCTSGYVRAMRDGSTNPAPRLRVLRDEETTAIVDGDGGLGHLPTHRATQMAIAKAKKWGVAAAIARNHCHFGGAGKYTRMAARENCVGFCVSGHLMPARQLTEPDWNPIGNPPMSFAFPAGEECPLNLDMGTSFFGREDFPKLFEQAPAAFFKCIGLVGVANYLAGIMANMMGPDLQQQPRQWASAQFGGFVVVVDIARFVDIDAFKAESDRTMRDHHALPPLPGCQRYDFPGGQEHEHEREYQQLGIPVAPDHQQGLEEVADELGVPVPWR